MVKSPRVTYDLGFIQFLRTRTVQCVVWQSLGPHMPHKPGRGQLHQKCMGYIWKCFKEIMTENIRIFLNCKLFQKLNGNTMEKCVQIGRPHSAPISPTLKISHLIHSVMWHVSIKALSMYYQNAKEIVEENKTINCKEKIIQKLSCI